MGVIKFTLTVLGFGLALKFLWTIFGTDLTALYSFFFGG